MLEQVNIFANKWCDIVFENRNKEYGAYQLRKGNDRNILLGIIFSVLTFSIGISTPVILKYLENLSPDESIVSVSKIVLENPPSIDKMTPPLVPLETPPVKPMITFTPPIITEDENVTEDPIPTNDILHDNDAGPQTVIGDPGAEVLLEEDPTLDAEGKPFVSVEVMPEFPGGNNAMMEFVSKNITYPAIAKENRVTGKVYISFVIDPSGKVKDVKLGKGIGDGCDEEAMKVIKSMPQWKPGKQNGKTVNVSFTIPIKFSLR